MRWIVAILPLLVLCGCRTKYVATEYHSTDTLSIRDTLYIERAVAVSAFQVDSTTTTEIKAATIKITDFDSAGRVARVTDIAYSGERTVKSGSEAVTATTAHEIEQSSHSEQSASTADYKKEEIKVPYVPWWVTAAGIAMILVVIVFFIRFVRRLVFKVN